MTFEKESADNVVKKEDALEIHFAQLLLSLHQDQIIEDKASAQGVRVNKERGSDGEDGKN